jgi:hypothetical protein
MAESGSSISNFGYTIFKISALENILKTTAFKVRLEQI